MRIIILFVLANIFLSNNGSGQEFAISNHKQNVFYIGLSNPISIAVSKFGCKDVKLIASDGKVEPTDVPCDYIILPDKPGKIVLSLYEKKTNILIGIEEYRVRYLPEPNTSVAGKRGGNIRKDILNKQLGVFANQFMDIDIDNRFRIDHYSIAIKREQKVIFDKLVFGPYFDEEIKWQFDRLKLGDKLIIYDVTGKGIDSVVRHLSNLELTIIE